MSDEFETVRAATDEVKPRSGLSLRARAVGLLSRREHSRVELSRKLSAHAQSPEELSTLLDALAKEGWQSDQRFVQGFVHRKAGQQGLAKIAQELTHQGIDGFGRCHLRHQTMPKLTLWRRHHLGHLGG